MMEETLQVRLIPLRDLPDDLQRLLRRSDEQAEAYQEELFLRRGESCIVCANDERGRTMMNLLSQGSPAEGELHPRDLFFRRLLEGKTEPDSDKQMKAFGVRPGKNRNVILFTSVSRNDGPLIETFREMAPTERNDILVPLDFYTVALIKTNQTDEGEDAFEYACAAVGTLESEQGMSVRAGIGNCRDEWKTLYESCREAKSALVTAGQFRLSGSVFRYRELLTERILAQISPEKRRQLKKDALPEEARNLLNQEMLETIRVFFRNDLNISTASRQLFIHRNTLLYRLEKIRKTTGLDLRKFSDAAAFNLLMTVPEDEMIQNGEQ